MWSASAGSAQQAPPALISKYLLRDLFTTAEGAPLVSPRSCEGGPGTLTIVDTGNKLSISGGQLVCAAPGVAAWGDPAAYAQAIGRWPGRTLFGSIATGSQSAVGWGDVLTGLPSNGAMFWMLGAVLAGRGVGIDGGNGFASGLSGTSPIACMLRLKGALLFAKIGSTWTLLQVTNVGASVKLYPQILNNTGAHNYNPIQVQDLPIVTPIASDGFSAWGTTDGRGHYEGICGILSGNGLTWTEQSGTFGVAAGVASASALAGGLAMATVSPSSDNVMVQTTVTRAGGNVGLVVRYTDANNYVYGYHDGTNITLRKVVGGVDSEVIAPIAAAYTASNSFGIAANGQSFRIFYVNTGFFNVANSTIATIADAALQTGDIGLYTTNTGNTFDNFWAYATGVEGQYAFLEEGASAHVGGPIVPTSYNIWPYGDSRTSGFGDDIAAAGYPARMTVPMKAYFEIPTRVGVGGTTVAARAAAIAADLAAAVGTPDYILINLGVNDWAANSATWKTDLTTIIDAMNVKWASAKIYIMRPWSQGNDAAADTRATDIAAVVASRSAFAFLGPDERVFLKGSDDGATYTVDGVHPNAAGFALTATEWRGVLI